MATGLTVALGLAVYAALIVMLYCIIIGGKRDE